MTPADHAVEAARIAECWKRIRRTYKAMAREEARFVRRAARLTAAQAGDRPAERASVRQRAMDAPCLSGGLHTLGPRRIGGGFAAVAHAELRQDPADVVARSLLGDEQRLGDSSVRHPERHKVEYLLLTRGELALCASAGARRSAEIAEQLCRCIDRP